MFAPFSPQRIAPAPAVRLGACALALIAVGCSAIRFDPEPQKPEAPRVALLTGRWTGALEVEGHRISGTLLLRQEGEDLAASFTAPDLGGESSGAGTIQEDGSVQIELRYHTQCPGRVQLNGAVLDDAGRLAGSLAATDCTGRAAGAFTFVRR